MTCAFTEEHYKEIVRAFLSAGYRFTCFSSPEAGRPHRIVMRHDVDLSLREALRMARIEAEMGISAVYHVMVTSDAYNPATGGSRAIIEELRSLGHHVGLHVDAKALFGDGDGRPDAGEALLSLFSLARLELGTLDSFSWHRPLTHGMLDGLPEGRLPAHLPPDAHAMSQSGVFVTRTDSRRVWRTGCVCSEVPSFEGQPLQLVIHPIWWTTRPATRSEVLRAYLAAEGEAAEDYLCGNLAFVSRRDGRLIIEGE